MCAIPTYSRSRIFLGETGLYGPLRERPGVSDDGSCRGSGEDPVTGPVAGPAAVATVVSPGLQL